MPLYDVTIYNNWLQNMFSNTAIEQRVFSYPPTSLIFFAPFGLLPYGLSYFVWMAMGVVAFWFAAFYRTENRTLWLPVALIATSAIVICNLAFGQLGLFLACCFVGAMRLLPTRPLMAGVLVGILTVKPQLGPLIVLLLLLRKEWLAIAMASATALAMITISIVLWGIAPWYAYTNETVRIQAEFLREMTGFWSFQMTTPFSTLRILGADYNFAMLSQILASALIFAASILVLRRKNCPWSLQVTIIAFGAALFTPYLLAYDLAIPLTALLWYLSSKDIYLSKSEILIVAILWCMPFALGINIQMQHVPILCLSMIVCYIMLLRRAISIA
jgi:alpha-1,2-mannosyltransferase